MYTPGASSFKIRASYIVYERIFVKDKEEKCKLILGVLGNRTLLII
jgi:hypothetical protein